MHLKTVFIRFYKSFNFDYLRKHHRQSKPLPWEMLKDAFYPYVRIPIDPLISTVVGANESGKSHLLTAIERGISGAEIKSEDFCRYSRFFGVVEGAVRCPDFGIEWAGLSDSDKATVLEICGLPASREFQDFLIFRTHDDGVVVYVPHEGDYTRDVVTPEKAIQLGKILPTTFRIDAKVALPASVNIRDLAPGILGGATEYGASLPRRSRFDVFRMLQPLAGHTDWFSSPQAVQDAKAQVGAAVLPIVNLLSNGKEPATSEAQARERAEVNLARELIRKVARIDEQALKQLYEALRDGREGQVSGLIDRINAALAARLNFARFWVQDRDFALIVSPREQDLVFTVRDRTGTQYSFDERSSGLKYFLSYYIQYLAHEHQGPSKEILLMDEPDAYLSSQAQQDLLKVFHAFACPEGNTPSVQVVYVTHSPFLIDKNHADRIRVLEKGVGDEGTRVVRDASRNHYEPLRSAFGAFVGETAFIGHCNLMVEGLSDQIILAGVATWLRDRNTPELELLDLNQLTIVQAGGASQVPYLAYLARGRDLEKPAVVVLLDSDAAGDEARKALKRGAPRGRQILDDGLVMQIGELQGIQTLTGALPREIEDLIPISLCVSALQTYAKEFCQSDSSVLDQITAEGLNQFCTQEKPVFDAIQDWAKTLGTDGLHVNKVGFARAVMEAVQKDSPQSDSSAVLERNFRIFFRRLRELQRKAERERNAERVTQKIDRLKSGFLQDHPDGVSRELASVMLEDMEATLDDSAEADSIRAALKPLSRKFHLHEDLLKPVDEYSQFCAELEKLRYVPRLESQNSHAE